MASPSVWQVPATSPSGGGLMASPSVWRAPATSPSGGGLMASPSVWQAPATSPLRGGLMASLPDQRNLPLSDTPMIRGSLNTAAM
jgi:hypothetical protein